MINCLGSSRAVIESKLFSGQANDLSVQRILRGQNEALVGAVTVKLSQVPAEFALFNSRLTQLLFALIQQLQPEIERLRATYAQDRIGIVLGSSTSGIGAAEEGYIVRHNTGSFPPEYHYHQQELGTVSGFLRCITGFNGPAYTVSTACSSSAKVLGSARMLLDLGICDAVITGGVDSLCRLTAQGFNALELLTVSRSNPLSANRKGLNLGEGGALLILERLAGGVQLLGIGEGSDAYHISAPHPEGRGAITAMRSALDRSEVATNSVKYINLHGTGTVMNDAMESVAVSSVFASELTSTLIPCSSTKPFVGHLLGAAGATEIGFCYAMLMQPGRDKPLLPHLWDGVFDPLLPRLNPANVGDTVRIEAGDTVLSSSFAFGGSNCAVILGLAG